MVILLLVGIAGLPALAAPAGAEPRTVTVATHELTPFVITHDGAKSGFAIELWEEIAKREGWSTKYLDVTDVTHSSMRSRRVRPMSRPGPSPSPPTAWRGSTSPNRRSTPDCRS
jgi:hypothetical protein